VDFISAPSMRHAVCSTCISRANPPGIRPRVQIACQIPVRPATSANFVPIGPSRVCKFHANSQHQIANFMPPRHTTYHEVCRGGMKFANRCANWHEICNLLWPIGTKFASSLPHAGRTGIWHAICFFVTTCRMPGGLAREMHMTANRVPHGRCRNKIHQPLQHTRRPPRSGGRRHLLLITNHHNTRGGRREAADAATCCTSSTTTTRGGRREAADAATCFTSSTTTTRGGRREAADAATC